MKRGFLHLASGEIFHGDLPDWFQEEVSGEVVFTTGMTGYSESLTDPSFAGQILTFTYPLLGNYGVSCPTLLESQKIQVKGCIISEATENYSHFTALSSLADWLKREKIPLLSGVDTRALTRLLRSHGTPLGAISVHESPKNKFFDPSSIDIVSTVTRKQPLKVGKGKKRVVAVDFGMKKSLLDALLGFPLEILVVPADYDYSEEKFDGIFLSNGPGDPTKCEKSIAILKKAMTREKPLFGVCLGCQLLALATGAKTEKLKFGHRGQNVPCQDQTTGRSYITSQNHGYAVDEKSLKSDWEVFFRNLNDGTVEGIRHRSKPLSAVQFHPEAMPGPTETRFLFERFVQCL